MTDSPFKIRKIAAIDYLKPFPLFIILLSTIFIVEALVMLLLAQLPTMPTSTEAVLDAFLLTLFVTPFVYLVALRPMINYLAELRRSDEALRDVRDQLEIRVEERTATLKEANRKLLNEVADREKAERALLEREKQYRDLSQQFHVLLDAIPDSLVLLSPDLHVQWANKSSMMGIETVSGDASSPYCYERWHCAASPCDGCPTLKSFATGRTAEIRMASGDGRVWDVRSFPMRDDNGRVVNVIELASDITEKVKLQEEAIRAAHLASLGELAAGVAHEINNPINGIINYAQILVNKNAANTKEHDIAGRIIKEGNRVAVIVSSLLTFARKGKDDMGIVQIAEVIFDCLALTRAQMEKENITIRLDVAPGLPAVTGNHQQLQQVFLNLINNARYALNQKYPDEDENKIFLISAANAGESGRPCLQVSFRDSGTGISPEVQEKMLNPFFSTKPPNHGTGLGLSISHGIVEAHGGRLLFDTMEGEYTLVTVELPVRANR